MTGAAVTMAPSIIAREQVTQGGQEVIVATRARFQDGNTCGRVRHEDVEQAIGVRRGREICTLSREIKHDFASGSVHTQRGGQHGIIVPAEALSRLLSRCHPLAAAERHRGSGTDLGWAHSWSRLTRFLTSVCPENSGTDPTTS